MLDAESDIYYGNWKWRCIQHTSLTVIRGVACCGIDIPKVRDLESRLAAPGHPLPARNVPDSATYITQYLF